MRLREGVTNNDAESNRTLTPSLAPFIVPFTPIYNIQNGVKKEVDVEQKVRNCSLKYKN